MFKLFCKAVAAAAALLALISFPGEADAQQTNVNPPVETILKGASDKREAYINEFKNLLSEETKTFSIFDKKGTVKKTRTVQSTFIVYQLSRNERSIAEFRNVVAVDGKKIADADKRAQNFFEAVSRAESSAQELDRIENEGSRFDEQLSVNGLTLYQAPVLAPNLMPFFDFKLVGMETLSGRSVYLISYEQNRQSPFISIDPRRRSDDGNLTLIFEADISDDQRAQPRLKGKLWVDADTLRVRREDRVLTIQRDGQAERHTVSETVFEYQDSDFDILTPKKIVFTQFRPPKKGAPALREVSIAYEYQNFTKPDVEVKGDVKSQ